MEEAGPDDKYQPIPVNTREYNTSKDGVLPGVLTYGTAVRVENRKEEFALDYDMR